MYNMHNLEFLSHFFIQVSIQGPPRPEPLTSELSRHCARVRHSIRSACNVTPRDNSDSGFVMTF